MILDEPCSGLEHLWIEHPPTLHHSPNRLCVPDVIERVRIQKNNESCQDITSEFGLGANSNAAGLSMPPRDSQSLFQTPLPLKHFLLSAHNRCIGHGDKGVANGVLILPAGFELDHEDSNSVCLRVSPAERSPKAFVGIGSR